MGRTRVAQFSHRGSYWRESGEQERFHYVLFFSSYITGKCEAYGLCVRACRKGRETLTLRQFQMSLVRALSHRGT